MKLVVVGDTVPAEAPNGSALPLLARDGVTLANLETPLYDHDRPEEKEVTVRAPITTARHLRDLGVDVVSVANNHALDHGADGLLSTISALDEAGVRHAGGGRTLGEADAGTVLDAGGERLTVLSFCSTLPPGANATSTRPGIAPLRVDQSFAFDGTTMQEQPGTPPYIRTTAQETDVRRVEARIRAARAASDRVVVCLHWGVPWCYLPENQGPLAEYQQPLGRRLIDAGADVVVGTHPHCLHPVEQWNGGLILYSAGNFLFHTTGIGKPELYFGLPYQGSRLFSGPWFDSAVFEIDLARPGAPELRLTPIALDRSGEPQRADEETTARLLRTVETYSRDIDPAVRVQPDGLVVFGRP
ncbi:CapA family protein [Streptomyces javensis]|uniref:CapA family protein n=1 Tax=Streptomyces javensis TaxID=114698 RepID=UPI0033BFF28B